jgi:mannan endo-1,6-alpha-mannosidase
MYEQACEDVNTVGTCDTDQQSFKAYLSRWMAATAKLVPSTASYILPLLQNSAAAAAAQCDGGATGEVCGEHWTAGSAYDGTAGVGQQMSALSVIQGLLIEQAPALVTNSTGGTSVGNAAAGGGSSSSGGSSGTAITPATGGDKAGAGILTALVLCGLLAGVWFMVSGA